MYLSVHHLSIHSFIHKPTHPTSSHSPTYPSTYPLTHPSIHSSTHTIRPHSPAHLNFHTPIWPLPKHLLIVYPSSFDSSILSPAFLRNFMGNLIKCTFSANNLFVLLALLAGHLLARSLQVKELSSLVLPINWGLRRLKPSQENKQEIQLGKRHRGQHLTMVPVGAHICCLG